MVKKLEDLERNPMQSETIKGWAMEIMQYIFTRSQENLNIPMEWGDSKKPSSRKPTVIFYNGELMRSGVPPYWDESENMVSFGYSAPHGLDVEYGSMPKKVKVSVLANWAMKKLRKRPKAAWTMARNIAAAIERDGISPHPWLRPAIHDMISRYGLNIKGPDL